MQKTILITGSTDGIGLEAAKLLLSKGHRVLLHGRSSSKLDRVALALSGQVDDQRLERYVADLSRLADVEALAKSVAERHPTLDVVINNAGVFHSADPTTEMGLDVRFVVNTVAPYLLTKRLLPQLGAAGRVVNVSSAAQAPVDLKALTGDVQLGDGAAYAQSKLALTMWSRAMALSLGDDGPMLVAVNPGSMLGTKMVRDGFGVAGGDIGIGAEILDRAALADEFATASGLYFDNDSGRFASPHPDALDPEKSATVVGVIEGLLTSATT